MGKVRDIWVRIALAVALLIPLYFAFAALGSKYHLIPWRFGLGTMTVGWGPMLLIGAAGFAALGFLLALIVSPRQGRRIALVALLIPLLGLGYAAYVRANAQELPPIHDVSTDQDDPPIFSESVVLARAAVEDGNDLQRVGVRLPEGERWGSWAGMPLEEAQRAGYRDIAPVIVSAPPQVAFDAALAAARAQGWTIGETDPAEGRIEATAESFWFGFIDDIAIRVRPEGEGSRIDVRSVSRVGLSDLGANAARVRKYLTDLQGRLSG